MKINHNIQALNAYNKLAANQGAVTKSLEKLSSGKRINRAADDAAGMAIAQKMHTQVNGLSVASRNALDGISVIQTAEGALNEVHSMLQRMRELSIQAANGTLTNDDRLAVQDEVNQLKTEINRIANSTEFNTRKLLNGEIDKRASSDNGKVATLKYLSDVIEPGKYTVEVTSPAKKAFVQGGNIPALTSINFVKLSDGTQTSMPMPGIIYINDEKVTIEQGDTMVTAFAKLKDLCYKVGVDLYSEDAPPRAGHGNLVLLNRDYGTGHVIKVAGDKNTLAAFGLAACTSKDATAPSVPSGIVLNNGADITINQSKLSSTYGFASGTTAVCNGDEIKLVNSGDFEIRLKGSADKFSINSTGSIVSTAAITGSVSIDVLTTGPLNLQIGANANQVLEVRIGNMSTAAMEIDDLNVYTEKNAEDAITSLDNAIRYVSRFRSKLGAYQNRLEHTTANLDTANENMTASLSRIEDADMASEMAEYTKNNVLIQAGTSMLAQANQLPQTVLQLLK